MEGMKVLEELNAKWQQCYPGLSILQFSDWTLWQWRSINLKRHINYSGVYILAKYGANEMPVSVDVLDRHIICVGKTIGREKTRSLKERLNDFNSSAFRSRRGHAEGLTYKHIYGDRGDDLYVSICPIYLATEAINHVGDVKDIITWLEVCLRGCYVYKHGRLPKLNKE
jgi:hypothetical protein